MFPDSTLKWRPCPSIIDGIGRPPFVLDRGLWRGVLSLIVLEARPGTRAYGVEVPCQIYGAFQEMIYSIAAHGDGSSRYDGGAYIKEAESSHLLEYWAQLGPKPNKPLVESTNL